MGPGFDRSDRAVESERVGLVSRVSSQQRCALARDSVLGLSPAWSRNNRTHRSLEVKLRATPPGSSRTVSAFGQNRSERTRSLVLRVLGRANRGIGLRLVIGWRFGARRRSSARWIRVDALTGCHSCRRCFSTVEAGSRVQAGPQDLRHHPRTGGRRMDTAVHLEGIHCGGEAYAGCDAACLIFWKDVWLKRVRNAANGPSWRGAGWRERRTECLY